MKYIRLKAGRERSVLRRHPWIYSGAVAEVEGRPEVGETVEVLAADGTWLARAAYSPHSQITARIWTWDPDESVDTPFFRRRLQRALGLRRALAGDPSTDAYREVHAESDGLPGLVVDRYADYRVVQFLSAGPEAWRETLLDLLAAEVAGVYERSDVEVRSLEGLPPRAGPARGEAPPERLEIRQQGLRFWVDLARGHKTGFYLDQRENRSVVEARAAGAEVLDGFCYTGGFTLAALRGGAAGVTAIDTSEEALRLAEDNVALNGLEATRVTWVQGDVFQELRRLRDAARSFDLIVLDPPKFAPTARQAPRAARGYKDINLLAFKLLRPGGTLVTFSCSGGVSPELFQKIVADAALDAGAEVVIQRWLSQPEDHPVALNFPEARYLKGLVCRRLS